MIWFRKKSAGSKSAHPQLRSALLGELTLATAAIQRSDDPDTPLSRLTAAQASVLVGDRAQARRHLQDLLDLPEISTQTRIQAWNCLRELEVLPSPGQGALVRGVAVEIGSADGLETLVAYEDRSATRLDPNGKINRVDKLPGDVVQPHESLLTAARQIVAHTHPHRGAPGHPPEAGHTCIRVMTYAGTHIGMAPTDALEHDDVGGPALAAAHHLRAALAVHSHGQT